MSSGSGGGPRAGAFDARAVPPPVRVGLWERATARFLVPMAIAAPAGSIVGVIGTHRVGGASFCRISASPHTALRSGEVAGGPGAGNYKVAVGLHGRSVISQHGRRVSLGPGDLTVYDTSEEYSVRSDVPFGLLVALLPHDLVDVSRDRVAAVAATTLAGEHAGTVRGGLLRLTTGSADDALDGVARSVTELVRAAPPARAPGRRDADDLLHRAREVIAARLDDPGLTPDHVAAVLGVSRRYLYGLFAERVGPVARYVRTQRLELARHLLVTTAAPVADVALACGLPDPAHFSRLFRRAYRVSPLAYRRAALPAAPARSADPSP